MGCGTSSHLPKKDTRAQSQVTVAAQQRAEAAYRRQRMAQERAEETAVWRAEMEVERARLLKEMSGGGSRRPSYCKELEDLKEEAPEVRDHLNDYLQGYTVERKNARNSLPVNEYPKSNVIAERRASREERDRQTYRQQKARENDENGNANRRLSTGEKIDLDFLRIIANRSNQASPSNVHVEENEQDRNGAKNVQQTSESNLELVEKVNEETKNNEYQSITENVDGSQDHMSDKPVNSLGDATSTNNEDVSTTHEYPTTVDDDEEKTDHDSERSSNIKVDNSSEGLQGSEHVNPDDDNNTAEVAENESVDTREMIEEGNKGQVQQEIAGKQEQQNDLLRLGDKEMEQQRDEGEEHEGQIPEKQEEQDNEKQHRPDEEQDHHQQADREKEQKEPEQTTENLDSAAKEIKEVKTVATDQETLETDRGDSTNSKDNDSPDVTSVDENSKQNNDRNGWSDDVRNDKNRLKEEVDINQ